MAPQPTNTKLEISLDTQTFCNMTHEENTWIAGFPQSTGNRFSQKSLTQKSSRFEALLKSSARHSLNLKIQAHTP